MLFPLGAHMSQTVTDFEVHDIRFPTSEQLDGSDAMNPDPDYSAAYVVLRTDGADGDGGGIEGHGFCFTIGRGNEVMAAAIEALRPYLTGRPVPRTAADLGELYRDLTHDSQLRWLGPEKGVMHMAAGAVLNAAWDLAAKHAGRPVWQFLVGMTPEELVSLVDFRYLTDALTPEEALAILRAAEPGRAERAERLRAEGYPAYTTSPGWLGYSDDKLVRLAKEAVADGFTQIKLKVGGDVADDVRRLALARDAVGTGVRIAVDANQRWDVADAVEWMTALAPYDPHWIEEPTSPDDILGHAAVRATSRSRSPPVNTSPTASCSSSCSRPEPSTSSRSTPHASPGSTRTWRSCCSPPSSACPSARTPGASACASWSSTSRCSTTWRSPAPGRTG